jgi:subtilisin family serine protease
MKSFRASVGAVVASIGLVFSFLTVAPATVSASDADPEIPVSVDASRAKYIVVARSGDDYGSLRADLVGAGAEILDEYRDIFFGASALLTPQQVLALQSDERVRIVEQDDVISSEASEDNDSDIIPGRYIIEMIPRANAVAQENVLSVLGDNVIYQYTKAFRGFAANLTQAEVKYLRSNPAIKTIEPDRIVRIDGEQSNPTWGLDRIDQQNRPLDSRYSYQGTGSGVTAYVVDTGIYSSHSDFGGRVRLGYPVGAASDCQGHGTHVAGTVGGATYGVAKNVSLVSVRVLDCNGSGTNSGVIAGLDWIVSDHAAGVKAVANMSLGGAFASTVNSAVERVINDGVVMVVAAGNESVSACTKSPASTPAAVTVAASDSSDYRASFSNYGSCVDLFAPGVSILSTLNGGGSGTKSGTSMASPHVAGAAAVLWGINSGYSASQVSSALINMATQNKVYDTMGSPNKLLFLPPSSGVAPGAPQNVTASFSNGTVTVSWSAPASTGSNAVSSYDVVTSAGSSVCTWTSGPLQCQVSNLSQGTYQFKATATSSAGTSPFSSLSNSVTVSAAGNNDFFSSAQSLTGASGSTTDSNVSATRESGEPTTHGSTNMTKWYSFVAPSNGSLSLTTVGSSFDTVLGVFTGSSVSSLTRIASDDDSGGSYTSSLMATLVGGTTYYFQVGSWGSTSGSIRLNWSFASVACSGSPSNDNLSCASVLTGSNSSTSGSTSTATLEVSELDTVNVCRSVWYRVTPTEGSVGTFSTVGSSFDTVLTVYRSSSSATYGSLAWVAANDNGGANLTSYISGLSMSVGYTYYVRVAGYSSGTCSAGSFSLAWTISAVGSVPGAPTSVSAVAGLNSATVSWSAPSSNGGSTISSYTVTSSPGGYTCTTSTLSCTVAGLSNGNSYTFTVVARNVTGTSPSSSPSNSVTISYVNDNIAGALGISAGTVFSSNSAATSEVGEPTHGGVGGGKSMWFRYSTSTMKNVTLSTRGSTFDTVLAVYSSSTAVVSSGSVYGTVYEGSTLSLSAPAGTVFTGVSFASYGNPDGDAGSYTLGSCHASNTSAIISSTFVGQNSGSVVASNATFGDPCPGTFKRLYVKLTYGAASSATFGSLVAVASNDDAQDSVNGSSLLSFVARPNLVYYVAVDGYDSYSGVRSGSITLTTSDQTMTLPGVPTRVLASPLSGAASVSWLKPDTNFLSITGYRVTSSPGGLTCETPATVFTCVVAGLSNGVAYSFSVVSLNEAGSSFASLPSPSVTPSPTEVTRSIAPTWGIDRVDERVRSGDGYLTMAGSGRGARIYIVDTGVKSSHEEFAGRMLSGYSSIVDPYGTNDCNGHGTHVASSAAGQSYGIARSANIVPVRVLDCDGYGSNAGVIAGLNWVASNIRATNANAVVNMSLGGSYYSAINLAVSSITALGVPVVVAAGNDGQNACNSSPASEPSAITVAASTSSDEEAGYSNYGSCVDIFGPGSEITAAGISTNSSLSVKSGTSMASPHVAGFAAVVKGLFPTANATAVANALVGTATTYTLTRVSSSTPNRLLFVGSPRCDIASAAGVVCNSAASTPTSTRVTLISTGKPATAKNLATTARLTVPKNARISLKVSSTRTCKVKSSKVYAVKSGTCVVKVTVAAKGRKTVSKTLKIRVKK